MADTYHRHDRALEAAGDDQRVVRDRLWHVEDVGPPNQSANKQAWVEFAVRQGWGRDAAEAATKDELIEELS